MKMMHFWQEKLEEWHEEVQERCGDEVLEELQKLSELQAFSHALRMLFTHFSHAFALLFSLLLAETFVVFLAFLRRGGHLSEMWGRLRLEILGSKRCGAPGGHRWKRHF